MAVEQQAVLQALQTVLDPNTGKDFVSTKCIKNLQVQDDDVSFDVELGYPAKSQLPAMRKGLIAAAKSVPGVQNVSVNIQTKVLAHAVQRGVQLMPNVKNIIAVASGKGGVGKSTTTVNLALALAAEGARVGILDADIYGPSQPRMMGVSTRPASPDGKTILPLQAHGVTMISIGLMMAEDDAVIWRGPMLMGALQQLLTQVAWGNLDALIVDMPPGTGDVQLTLCQRFQVAGAIVVSTPQDVALLDARKAIRAFQTLKTPILGLVENMSTYICPKCGHEEHIFGDAGVRREAERLGLPFLGALPLAVEVRLAGDGGMPVAATDSPVAEAYRRIARDLIAALD